MPIIQLIRKDSGEAESFCDVDNKMCAAFGVKSDPDNFFKGWYDNIGRHIRDGLKLEDIGDIYKKEIADDYDFGRMTRWLMENYTTEPWRY